MTRNAHKNLTTYLNDHLAGSVAALEMLDNLKECCPDEPLKQFLEDIQCEIETDQKVLERLIEGADENESVLGKTAAWVTEKFARAKFKLGGEELGGLGLAQALETLVLGIRGKELLWHTLKHCGYSAPSDVDLGNLEQRAIEQQQWVEEKRLEAARAALGNKAL